MHKVKDIYEIETKRFSLNSVSTHIVTPTKQSAAESTRNKIHAIKRIELPRDFMIHLSESLLAIPY